MRRKFAFWTIGIVLGIGVIAIGGSGYGFWATKKIMNFSSLEQETKQQQEQLQESMEQADVLQRELDSLNVTVQDLIKQIDPRAAAPDFKVGSEVGGDKSSDSLDKVSALKTELDGASQRLKNIQAHMAPVVSRWNHTPSVEPTTGYISSGFGVRIDPFYHANTGGDGLMASHTGIDIANVIGTPIQATANGVVTTVKHIDNYGMTVIIRHTPELETLYAHLQTAYVREGNKVERGHIVGLMGRSGRTTGPHLHYEVRKDGKPVNPKPYLRLQRQWLTGLK
ncbi:MAG: M23 family metallopeptidase [Holophagales bacterium]|nr:M23 family metallopeptidase [Holophagales bacterium]